MNQTGRQADVLPQSGDPEPTTPFSVVAESGLLRLRHYRPTASVSDDRSPVLLVYPVIKRPSILDLTPDRSVIGNLLAQGLDVYLTDWLPPGREDRKRGFNEYVNEDLNCAVDVIRALEDTPRVSLIGCCCGGLFSSVYTAFNPDKVGRLVNFAVPFSVDHPGS